jgi:hypothetical protein
MDKKGIEMTMQTIVVAAVLLLVLVVIIMVFNRFVGLGVNDADDAHKGLECSEVDAVERFECNDDEIAIMGNFKAIKEGKVCCRPK